MGLKIFEGCIFVMRRSVGVIRCEMIVFDATRVRRLRHSIG
jgi:hypothetical protein